MVFELGLLWDFIGQYSFLIFHTLPWQYTDIFIRVCFERSPGWNWPTQWRHLLHSDVTVFTFSPWLISKLTLLIKIKSSDQWIMKSWSYVYHICLLVIYLLILCSPGPDQEFPARRIARHSVERQAGTILWKPSGKVFKSTNSQLPVCITRITIHVIQMWSTLVLDER